MRGLCRSEGCESVVVSEWRAGARSEEDFLSDESLSVGLLGSQPEPKASSTRKVNALLRLRVDGILLILLGVVAPAT